MPSYFGGQWHGLYMGGEAWPELEDDEYVPDEYVPARGALRRAARRLGIPPVEASMLEGLTPEQILMLQEAVEQMRGGNDAPDEPRLADTFTRAIRVRPEDQ